MAGVACFTTNANSCHPTTQPPNHPPQHSSSHRFQIQLRQSFIEIVVPALSETRTLGSGRLARTPARLLGVTETPGRQFPRIPAWDLVVPLGGTAVPLLRAMLMYKKKVSATGGLSRLNRGCCIVSSCAPPSHSGCVVVLSKKFDPPRIKWAASMAL